MKGIEFVCMGNNGRSPAVEVIPKIIKTNFYIYKLYIDRLFDKLNSSN